MREGEVKVVLLRWGCREAEIAIPIVLEHIFSGELEHGPSVEVEFHHREPRQVLVRLPPITSATAASSFLRSDMESKHRDAEVESHDGLTSDRDALEVDVVMVVDDEGRWGAVEPDLIIIYVVRVRGVADVADAVGEARGPRLRDEGDAISIRDSGAAEGDVVENEPVGLHLIEGFELECLPAKVTTAVSLDVGDFEPAVLVPAREPSVTRRAGAGRVVAHLLAEGGGALGVEHRCWSVAVVWVAVDPQQARARVDYDKHVALVVVVGADMHASEKSGVVFFGLERRLDDGCCCGGGSSEEIGGSGGGEVPVEAGGFFWG
ncbi:UDP-3-O-[3-hydroxymyristoyl] N-acetylglucosaminedeacetylase [Striga asiatica]|uniref:UDP-3-O-[3-hydroxymyristoyl] N-acetylglucosaminedeacetylase n=1 Tax=Striga asiatica TaxID=4170 RepID=A0A5A7RJM2_STRAF|nr:UDP-3-O-[3-hydroxymyristoyl] N-acetylglucosaminedeacetylase [Striga asiatica]